MGQTRLESLFEAIIGTVIGFVLATIGQLIIFPLLGVQTTFGTNLQISLFFTFLSVGRGYVIRRWFNTRMQKLARSMAAAVQR